MNARILAASAAALLAASAALADGSASMSIGVHPKRRSGGGMAKTAIAAKLKVTSPAFAPAAMIPKRHTCEGEDVSPALSWSGASNVKSWALIMEDPDAPTGTWVHWVLYDLPGSATGLPEAVAKDETLRDGAKQGASWGVTHYERVGYSGPCPPPGKPHRYFFKVYGLDTTLKLPAKAGKEELLRAMGGHVIAQGELIGLFKR